MEIFDFKTSRFRIRLNFVLGDWLFGIACRKHYGPRLDFWVHVILTLQLGIELVYRDIFKNSP